MLFHPNFGNIVDAPIAVTARQWQAAKQHATCFGDNKNRPGKWSRLQFRQALKTLNQGAALMGVGRRSDHGRNETVLRKFQSARV